LTLKCSGRAGLPGEDRWHWHTGPFWKAARRSSPSSPRPNSGTGPAWQAGVRGPARLDRLERELARADTVWPGPRLTGTYVTVRTWCAKAGHGLGGKDHEADRWVAASAIWLDVPLVAHDAIFANVKDLTLLTKLDL
jgi:hypothetical protein